MHQTQQEEDVHEQQELAGVEWALMLHVCELVVEKEAREAQELFEAEWA